MNFSNVVNIIILIVIGVPLVLWGLIELLSFLLDLPTFFKNEKPILSEDEKKKFENFFERTIEGVDKTTESGIEIDKLKVWCINNDGSKKNDFKFFLEPKINSFHRNDDNTNGMLVYCHKSDGISWLAEKTLNMSNAILKENGYHKDEDKKIEINAITNDKSEFPIPITKFTGGKRHLLKLAIKERYIENISSSFVSNLVIFIVTLVTVITFIPDFGSVLEKIDINISIFQWRLIVGIVVSVAFVWNFYDLLKKSQKDKEKERTAFLDKLANNSKKEDKKYQSLIDKIIHKIVNTDNKKIIIIDDIASLDDYGFSKDVFLKYIEKTNKDKSKKIFWIIFSSDLSISREIINNSGAAFSELTLRLLDRDEKKKLCPTLLNLDNFDTIKEICTGQIDESARLSLQKELSELKATDLDLFNFLYLLTLNEFPHFSEYKIKQLTEKIPPRRQERERDVFIKKFFDSVPDGTRIEDYFNDDKIRKYYTFDKVSGKFSINNNVSRLIENDKTLFNYHIAYSYGQGYWALLWYYALQDKPNVHFVQKISHHLQNADNTIENVEVRTSLLNAHLFAAEKSLSYLQKKDVEKILDHALGLDIRMMIADIQKDRIARLIFEEFLNFDKFSDKKNKIEDFECKELYAMLKTREISSALSLLQNNNYSSISDYVISFLLEQYWERIFFLWIFDKAKPQYTLIDGISTELTELNVCFENYLKKEKDKSSPLYLFNLALYIWIDYIHLLKDNDSLQIEEIIGHIELFLDCYNKKNTDIARDDVYLQTNIQESICLVVSVILLLLKKQNPLKKTELQKILQKLKSVFNEVELDVNNYNKSIDSIMRFLLLHSLMWKNCDFSVRYTMLSIIRVQLFLFQNDKENNSEEVIVKAQELSRITEQLDNKNRLTTLLYFSLYLNSDLIKDEHKSSFLFQQALNFTDKNKISNIQFEYLYFCIEECWYHDSEKLKAILKCFAKNSDKYLDNIVEKICEYPASYLHICNCLNSFDDNELSEQKGDTEYTLLSFFDNILDSAKSKENADLEDAECIWENYKFQRSLNKQLKRPEFEKFWEDKKDNILFGEALEHFFELEENNITANLMYKTYEFLTNNVFKILNYSFNLTVACHFCNEKKEKEILDEEYDIVFNFIQYFEPYWEQMYGNLYKSSIVLYKTLFDHTEKNEYNDKYKNYKLLETQKKIENFEITDSLSFFYSLYKIFENDLDTYNDISHSEKQLLEQKDIKRFLESVNYDDICVIYDNQISIKYIMIYRVNGVEFAGRENMLKKCNGLAASNINNLIRLIVQTPGNRKYLERIQKLFTELNKTMVSYDDEE